MNPAKTISRRAKVATLAPLALASCLATVSVLATAGADAQPSLVRPLPDHRSVPTRPVQIQATPTQIDGVAPAVGPSAVDAVVSGATTSGIPAVALSAYRRAAQVIDAADPSCNMPWELIGAIGRVESDHGQFGGNHLDAHGEAVPGIYGPLLDGRNGTSLVSDTDGGALDHSATYDRAVGPMQFLPSTWAVVGVDATGNGKRDPQNIDDAALAAAVYLCSGHGNMANPSDVHAAVFRYNHSDAYVSLVMRIMQAYQAGSFSSIPIGAYAAPALSSRQALPRGRSAIGSPRPPTVSRHESARRPSGSPSTSPTPMRTPNLLQSILGGLSSGRRTTPTPTPSSAALTPSQAASFCASHLSGMLDLLGTLHAECRAKVTGLTPAEASAAWAAHRGNLAAWLRS